MIDINFIIDNRIGVKRSDKGSGEGVGRKGICYIIWWGIDIGYLFVLFWCLILSVIIYGLRWCVIWIG